ncbi:MAG TPA: uroporphyrinogen decarboxylase family protein [Chthonomonadales bacterium]|nr:uroporphyrinogen decarboxylase family protein [Chthonomonadales bacterium]
MSRPDVVRPGDRLAGMDFVAHNAEVRGAWEAYHARRPVRVPIVLGTNSRYTMRIPGANPRRVGFREYSEDPALMLECQLEFGRWVRMNLLQDTELGPPERWTVQVDFQNYYEAAWFGCPIQYHAGEVPDTIPAYADAPERLLDAGLPDPFGGLMARGLEYHGLMEALAADRDYLGLPVSVAPPWFGMGSDGPLTVACSLFGAGSVCEMMASEPDRLRSLLEFITEATIRRMRAFRERFGVPVPQDGFGIADDSVALISVRMYREHVLPHHRRIYGTFGADAPGSIHLCGDATRLFVTIRDELNVRTFDTGFPVDFGRLRRDLGPDVRIQGGPHVELLRGGTQDQVVAEVRRILQSGVLEGGLFVLREGNNLAPETPVANTEAMYRAGREFGRLAGGSA